MILSKCKCVRDINRVFVSVCVKKVVGIKIQAKLQDLPRKCCACLTLSSFTFSPLQEFAKDVQNSTQPTLMRCVFFWFLCLNDIALGRRSMSCRASVRGHVAGRFVADWFEGNFWVTTPKYSRGLRFLQQHWEMVKSGWLYWNPSPAWLTILGFPP